MTTAHAVAASTSEVCRVTVVGPAGRADLAIPLGTPVSALLPVLARHVTKDPAERGTPWVLQRLGEDPLDADGTPATLGLRHGDVLHLRPAEEPLPALHFDDVADGVAQAVDALPGRWTPRLTRGLALAMAVLAMPALAAALLGFGPGTGTAVGAGVIAVALGAGCVAAARLDADRGTVLVAGLGSIAFGALAGLAYRHGPHGGYAPGLPGVLAAAVCVVVLAAVLLALRPLPLVVPGTVLLTALAAAVGTGLMRATGWHGAQAVTCVAVAMFVLGHFGPRLTLRMSRLRVPRLPHNAEELQEDIEPGSGERIQAQVEAASAYLDTLSVSSALVYVAGFWYMTRESGWIGWLLPLVFAGAVLLRSRGLNRSAQRVPMVVAGALGLLTVALARFAPLGTGARLAVVVVLLAAVAAVLAAAWRLPTGRLLPVWGHSGDLLETITAIALLPLLLQALHAYSAFRSLTS
ncbi:type VII secretion integral membrane protein EccD [Streptomyces sp. PTM05]|uniref:Type VII secretion integral membrane protein EccD n=1 Tax=Streptantibioticus parmotrematis TaxID=2873249 RepID=A0ABS7R092_9ACTN|nr:type VII secretion integral membrane protein EccD [Streptantibioticus parmotrematis]MBY8888877.1 type VII secretion integral membrane protein EccD [Streptantibioticus parmotrematis]